jgi:flagellar hook-associated protein 2
VFEFSYSADSPDLTLFSRTGALNDSEFTVDIVDADNDGVPESATIDGVAATIDGNTIIGTDGSDHEGLELIWTGTGSTSINVTATQGVAEKLYNYLDGALDDVDGTLTNAVESLEDANTEFLDEIEQIETRAETFRQQLIERFGAMEAALALAESMLQQVRAQAEALTADS